MQPFLLPLANAVHIDSNGSGKVSEFHRDVFRAWLDRWGWPYTDAGNRPTSPTPYHLHVDTPTTVTFPPSGNTYSNLASAVWVIWNPTASEWQAPTKEVLSAGLLHFAGGGAAVDWNTLPGKPSTFPPSAHNHAWADIPDKPTSFPPAAHTHSAADLTFGVLDPARLPSGIVTTAAMTTAIATAIAAIPAEKFLQGLSGYNETTNALSLQMSDGSTVSIDLTALLADAINTLLTTANVWTKQQTFTPAALAYASTLTWDAATGQKAKVTLTGNATLGAVANVKEGGSYLLIVTQDATGGRTLAFTGTGAGTVQVIGAAPTLSTAAGAVDLLTFEGVDVGGVIRLRFTGISKGA